MHPDADAADGPLYTIRDIARDLGLPESTVRYYRDAFAGYLPTVGSGRRRRYPPEAADVLRTVARGFAEGLRREQIEHALGGAPAAAAPPVEIGVRTSGTHLPAPTHDELLSTILDGERDRREAMWQMAREIVRLGEAIERQHELLSEVAGHMARQSQRALAAGPQSPPVGEPVPAFDPEELNRELDTLREQLEQERELVERLRRSRLDFERRATEAEERLEEAESTQRRGGLLGRFRGPEPTGGDPE